MNRKHIIALIACFAAGLFFYLQKATSHQPGQEAPYVNVYNWYGMIPHEVLRQFEKETGIRVRYDLYDNNEVLEAKLLASNSGYDVVFPSASPYVARQIAAKVYQPLNKALLPNLVGLDPVIISQMNVADPGIVYAIPYYWGTLGFAYVKETIDQLIPNAPYDSYRMLFDPAILGQLKGCGVSFLEEAVDVIPLTLAYLGLNRNSDSLEDLEKAYQHLLELRSSVRRFNSARFITDLVMGDVCLAQAWSGDIQAAETQAKELGKTIVYVVPVEGTTLWIDAVAIPTGAPHPLNAHRFIDFILRPEIAALITNATLLPTAVTKSLPLINPEILKNPTIYPSEKVMKRLHLDKPQNTKESLAYDRARTRTWAKVRLG